MHVVTANALRQLGEAGARQGRRPPSTCAPEPDLRRTPALARRVRNRPTRNAPGYPARRADLDTARQRFLGQLDHRQRRLYSGLDLAGKRTGRRPPRGRPDRPASLHRRPRPPRTARPGRPASSVGQSRRPASARRRPSKKKPCILSQDAPRRPARTTPPETLSDLHWTHRIQLPSSPAPSPPSASPSPPDRRPPAHRSPASPCASTEATPTVSPSDRNAQFEFIAAFKRRRRPRQPPEASTPRRRNSSATSRTPAPPEEQHPVEVLDHDFRSLADGLAVPYGIYDLLANQRHRRGRQLPRHAFLRESTVSMLVAIRRSTPLSPRLPTHITPIWAADVCHPRAAKYLVPSAIPHRRQSHRRPLSRPFQVPPHRA